MNLFKSAKAPPRPMWQRTSEPEVVKKLKETLCIEVKVWVVDLVDLVKNSTILSQIIIKQSIKKGPLETFFL